MPNAELAPEPFGAPGWLLDATLVAMVLLFAAGVAFDSMSTALVVGVAVHVFVSLYHGRFERLRKLTWLMLLGGWTLSFLIGFLGYVLPWGQMAFWIAAHLSDGVALLLWQRRGLEILTPAVGILVMLGALLDVVALHAPRLLTSRVAQAAAGVLALAIVVIVAHDVMRLMNMQTSAPPPSPEPTRIVPSTGFLPLFSLLRAGPTKALGAALPPILAVFVTLWPWQRAWRFHAAPTRLVFTLLWLGAGAGWVGLGVLGALAPEAWVITASQALAIYEIGFLAVMPPVLVRFLPPMQDRRATIF